MEPVTRQDTINRALTLLGQDPVADTRTDPSKGVKAGREWFRPSLNEMLRAREWNFATVKERLVESNYMPVEARWAVVFKYPTDCLKFLGIVDVFSSYNRGSISYPDYRGGGTVTIPVGPGVVGVPVGARIAPDGYGLSEVTTEARGALRQWEIRLRVTESGGTERVILTNLPDGIGKYVRRLKQGDEVPELFNTALAHLMAHRIAKAATGKPAQEQMAYYLKALNKAEVEDANENNDRPREQASWMRARGARQGFP